MWKGILSNKLDEISGMCYNNGKFYAHNDSGNPNRIYEVDTLNGAVTKTITLGTKPNIDWEDMTQDDTHIYIGDFGNNDGTRQDLVIYKFPKILLSQVAATFTIPDSMIESIYFSYPDQIDFTPDNNTPFDCEALAYRNQKLHLFSKNRNGGFCVHYTLPIVAGTYVAKKIDSMHTVGFQITAAEFASNKQLIMTSYKTSADASCALWLIYDFSDEDSCLLRGNRRRIGIGSAATVGQIEAVCFVDSTRGFAANEKLTVSGNVVQLNQWYQWNTLLWYPYQTGTGFYDTVRENIFTITFSGDKLVIGSVPEQYQNAALFVYHIDGRECIQTSIQSMREISMHSLASGIYIVEIRTNTDRQISKIQKTN